MDSLEPKFSSQPWARLATKRRVAWLVGGLFSWLGAVSISVPAQAQDLARPYRLPPGSTGLAPISSLQREPEEFLRRSVEIIAAPHVGWIGCGGSAPSSATTPDPCAKLGFAPGLDLAVLWRMAPHFAMGAWAGYAAVSWDARQGTADPLAKNGPGRWWNVGLEARGYLRSEGSFDPYVGFGLGAGFLSLTSHGVPDDITLQRDGLVSRATVGADWWVTGSLRLGPQLGFLWQPFGGTEICGPDRCLDASNALARMPNRSLRLSLNVTFGVGDEL